MDKMYIGKFEWKNGSIAETLFGASGKDGNFSADDGKPSNYRKVKTVII